jgi:rare lipoprotein A
VTIRAQEGALREGWCTPLLLGCRVQCKLMLLKSHYGVGDGYHGQTTANGERYNAYGKSVAHKWLPFGTRLRVINQRNGKSVIVRVNDRGPYIGGRDLDLSYGAFSSIASPSQGVASVCYSRV